MRRAAHDGNLAIVNAFINLGGYRSTRLRASLRCAYHVANMNGYHAVAERLEKFLLELSQDSEPRTPVTRLRERIQELNAVEVDAEATYAAADAKMLVMLEMLDQQSSSDNFELLEGPLSRIPAKPID